MTDAVAKSPLEQDFLEWFSANFQGKGLESRFTFGPLHSYCTSFSEKFQGHEIAGHGHDADSSLAALKGAAELIERRAVIEYFRRHPDEPLKNTNGWAVHLSRASAIESAQLEAIERHILLYTFLRSGWSEFVLLDQRKDTRGSALFLASPYTQNGYFGGMVVYQNHNFPGVSFGHLADDVSRIQSSSRWNHALFEAIAFVERSLETGSFSGETKNAFHKESCAWLLEPWKEPEWKKAFLPFALSDVEIGVETGNVSDLTESYAGLHYARVTPGGLIPLYMHTDLETPKRRQYVSEICRRYGISLSDGRIPIL